MKIEYDKANRVIYLTDKDGMREVLENDYPSEPVVSPKGEKAAYISPLEWECIGNLYMLDLVSGEKEILLVPKSSRRVPKGVIWIDKDNLAVILGFGMGTVETGGNVFFYNIKTDKLTQITQYDPYIQILSMHLEGELLRLEGIEYTDDNYLESKKFEEAIPI